MSNDQRYKTFADFYPFYLDEHKNQVSRRLHFVGTSIALVILVTAVVTQSWWLLVVALVQGYAFAWVGHFFFEKNRPATFKYPLWSLMGDWQMFFETVSGKRKF